MSNKSDSRIKRKQSIRKRISGDVSRPRLSVFRSSEHIYAQVIDDEAGSTLASASTLDPDLQSALGGLKKQARAKQVGQRLAAICLQKGIEKVVFDRNGFIYHGRVSALAEGAREGGLKF